MNSDPLNPGELTFSLIIKYLSGFLIVLFLIFAGLYWGLYSAMLSQLDRQLDDKTYSVADMLYTIGSSTAEVSAFGDADTFIRIIDESGKELFATRPDLTGFSLTQMEMKGLLETRQPLYKTIRLNLSGHDLPVRQGCFLLGPNTVLLVGQSLENTYELRNSFRIILVLVFVVVYVLTVLLVVILLSGQLKRINMVKQGNNLKSPE